MQHDSLMVHLLIMNFHFQLGGLLFNIKSLLTHWPAIGSLLIDTSEVLDYHPSLSLIAIRTQYIKRALLRNMLGQAHWEPDIVVLFFLQQWLLIWRVVTAILSIRKLTHIWNIVSTSSKAWAFLLFYWVFFVFHRVLLRPDHVKLTFMGWT